MEELTNEDLFEYILPAFAELEKEGKNMILIVIEECEVFDEDEVTAFKIGAENIKVSNARWVEYKVDSDDLTEALKEYEEGFKSENIICSEDYFEGECENSTVKASFFGEED